MPSRFVDVFDRNGGKLFSYSIALEEEDCLECEFEEAALILAESCGRIEGGEVGHLIARCDPLPVAHVLVQPSAEEAKPKRQKSTVVSLVKHRMKHAGSATERHRLRQTS